QSGWLSRRNSVRNQRISGTITLSIRQRGDGRRWTLLCLLIGKHSPLLRFCVSPLGKTGCNLGKSGAHRSPYRCNPRRQPQPRPLPQPYDISLDYRFLFRGAGRPGGLVPLSWASCGLGVLDKGGGSRLRLSLYFAWPQRPWRAGWLWFLLGGLIC